MLERFFVFEKLKMNSSVQIDATSILAIFSDCDKIAFVDDHTAKLPSFSRSLLPR